MLQYAAHMEKKGFKLRIKRNNFKRNNAAISNHPANNGTDLVSTA